MTFPIKYFNHYVFNKNILETTNQRIYLKTIWIPKLESEPTNIFKKSISFLIVLLSNITKHELTFTNRFTKA